ncbi:MAG: polysaccharide biosynthesis protein [Rickettsiaceae bacterium]|nr:polysaccharide biosynthesis protein [Rickettsiaceae bacterium]
MFVDKVLMITGGTGSFGNAVMKRLLKTDIKEIRIFSRDEKKQEDMRNFYKDSRLKFYIGDTRNYNSINEAMKGVNFVFHAAALKQVPSCEFYPMEAVQTNILGSENVINAAVNNDVERLIALSTDKAVYPINAMGLSKAMMEKVLISKARMRLVGETILCVTRYGNVMASRGSVIPLFVDQIKKNKPITITEPTMTRFLMSLEDSVDLVLYAFLHGKQGDTFVQKAPAATIELLALALGEIFNSKTKIHFIGTRHGEKQYESLVSSEEMSKAEDLNEYYRIPMDNRTLDYSKFVTEGQEEIVSCSDYTSSNTKQLKVADIKKLLLTLDFIKEQLNA